MSEESNEGKEKEVIADKIVKHIIEIDNGSEGDKSDKEKLEIAQNQLQALALKEFEDKKSSFVEAMTERFGSEQANKLADIIVDGNSLDRIKASMEIVAEKTAKSTPKGKTNSQAPQNTEGFNSTQEMIDKIYDELEREKWLQMKNSKDANPEKLAQLTEMTDKLLQSAIIGEKSRGEITKIRGVWSCPKCGATCTTSECSRCGYRSKSYNERVSKDEVVI